MRVCARCGASIEEGARFCSNCGAAIARGGRQAPVRKHVVIVFVDIVGSTSLGESVDPEALRANLARYFDAVSTVVWSCGGTVEKFIGDAVMAVFGVPVTREDDAIRAVEAATRIHEAVAGLSGRMRARLGRDLAVRIGVNQGEVFVTHQPDGQFSVTGDAVNVAARLQAAAGAGQTYVGDTVAELVSDAVALEAVGPVLHRGRTTPQQVFVVVPDADVDRVTARTPFAGRSEELAELAAIADRSARRGQGWFVTLVGEPGIGKHRLVSHFLGGRDGLRVLRGTAQPFAAGSSYAPLARLLGRLGDRWQDEVAGMFDERTATAVLRRLESATGGSDESTSSEDIAWAMRTVLAHLTASGPVAIVWEDLQWCSDAQLDLIERLVEEVRTLPVFTICLTRPELFERRPMWGGGRQSRVEDLDPLSRNDLRDMARERMAEVEQEAAERGVRPDVSLDTLITRSDGNPQVFEVLLQCLCDGTELPVSVHTLFEATLDRLAPAERTFCEGATILGREFYAAAVGPVLDDPPSDGDGQEIADRLRQLNILEITDSDQSGLTSYRFVQSMLMETAYRSMPRQVRSERHVRAAEWIRSNDRRTPGSSKQAVASHLRQAYIELSEIGGDPARIGELRESAATEGFLAAEELDLRGEPGARAAYVALFELFPVGDSRHHDVAHRAFFRSTMRRPGEVEEILRLADARLGDAESWRPQRAAMQLAERMQSGQIVPSAGLRRAREVSTAAILDAPDCPSVLIDVGWTLALAYGLVGKMSEGLAELEKLADLVDRSDDRPARGALTFARVEFGMWSDRPANAVLADVDAGLEASAAQRDRVLQLLPMRSWLRAMIGDRDRSAADWSRVVELAPNDVVVAHASDRWAMSLYSFGEALQAAQVLHDTLDVVESMTRLESSMWVVRLLLRGGDAGRARQVFGEDFTTQPFHEAAYSPGLREGVAAQLLAIQGRAAEALDQLEAARAAIDGVSMPTTVAESAIDEAVVRRLLGDHGESERAADRARTAYLVKGATAMAANVDGWLLHADHLRDARMEG